MPRLMLWLALAVALVTVTGACDGGDSELLLGVTSSVQDAGLLDRLVEEFEQDYDFDVKPIVGGSGQTIELARQGEFDVIMTHSPADERALIDDEVATDSTQVMRNYFQLVGPPGDPAGVTTARSLPEAFRLIADAGAHFISRGDGSGTHKRELSYWAEAGFDPAGEPWYSESASGQGQTLTLANDQEAYTLVDDSTFAVFEQRLDLAALVRDNASPNIYSVIRLNPQRLGDVNTAAGDAWIEFMTSDAGQDVVADYGVAEYGHALFEPLLLD